MSQQPFRPIPRPISQPETFYIIFNAPVIDQSCSALLNAISQAIMTMRPKNLHLAISSPGGSVPAAIGVYAALKALPIEIITHNIGNVDSAANIVYMAGKTRYANEYSSFLFHGIQANVPNGCSLEKLKEMVSQIEADHRRIAQIISSSSSIKESDVEAFFHQGGSISVERAVQYGIVIERKEFIIPPNAPHGIIA